MASPAVSRSISVSRRALPIGLGPPRSGRHGRGAAGASTSSSRGAAAPVDAIYVLCGGQTRAGGCPPWVEARAVAAASEWKRLGAMLPMVLLGGGSPHAPPVMNEWGQVKHEVRRE